MTAACLVLGALSLVLPSEPSYDPWAWLVWGREVGHLHLNTAGGPSWKPFPVAVTAILAPLGGIDSGLPAALWIALTRAASLVALVLAFRLARRLAGGGRAGTLAGAVAASSLFLLPDWFQLAAQGSDAPMAVALVLWAIERHLDGRVRDAVFLGAVASLLRPELFPFLALYGLYAWRVQPELRRLLAALAAVIPALWLVPEWIGAGNPLDGGKQAASEPYWSLSHHPRPWARALVRVDNHAGLLVELLAVAAFVSAALARRWAVLLIAVAAGLQVATFVAMTQAGFSGNSRYVLPGLALMCVLAGVGAAALVSTSRARALTIPLALALAALAVSTAIMRVDRLGWEAREVGARMELHRGLVRAVAAAGGAEAVAGCGAPSVNRALQTRMAWELDLPLDDLEQSRQGCFAFESHRDWLAGQPAPRARGEAVAVARVGGWRVYRVYNGFAGLSHVRNSRGLQGPGAKRHGFTSFTDW